MIKLKFFDYNKDMDFKIESLQELLLDRYNHRRNNAKKNIQLGL